MTTEYVCFNVCYFQGNYRVTMKLLAA